MRPTKEMIWDEARRRMAMVHGGAYGSNAEQKAMNSIIVHMVYPTPETLHRLRCHLAVLSASNILERDLPEDFQADHYWQLPEKLNAPEPQNVVDVGTLLANLAGKIEDLEKRFEGHDHKAALRDGRIVEWDDFVLKSQIEVRQ